MQTHHRCVPPLRVTCYSLDMQNKSRFMEWHYVTDEVEQSLVFPDGCRDVLILRAPDGPSKIIHTELDFTPRAIALPAGIRITGFRLRPGVTISPHALNAIRAETDRAEEIIGEACEERNDLEDAIEALAAPGATVKSVALNMGVSTRTLQRYFRERNQPPPDFWRLLARARRAAGMLASSAPLAEISDTCGFSDQAHMNREFLRWFRTSPAACAKPPR